MVTFSITCIQFLRAYSTMMMIIAATTNPRITNVSELLQVLSLFRLTPVALRRFLHRQLQSLTEQFCGNRAPCKGNRSADWDFPSCHDKPPTITLSYID
jgi:hypothetical protein